MSSALAYRSPEAVIFPEVHHESYGETVDEILKRLGNVEADVSKLKIDVGIIASNYATKSDIADLRTSIADLRTEIKVEIGGVRTDFKSETGGLRTELKTDIGSLRTSIEALESKIIKWIVATVLTTAGLAFSAAKFIH